MKKKHKRDHSDLTKSAKEKLDLWEKMQQGDTKALMKLSFMTGMISEEEYEDFNRIKRNMGKDDK